MEEETGIFVSVCLIIFVLIAAIGGGMWGCPQYGVYEKRFAGQAELERQEFEKLVLIEEAKAKFESSKLFAQAEVERAKGVAEANKIIGDSLKGNEAYLRYLWIEGLKDASGERVYIPTEAGIPILEAGR